MAQLSGSGQYAADDGSSPPDVQDVLAARAVGEAGIREVVTVLADHRGLVPLMEVDGDQLPDDDSDPCAGADRAVAAVSVRESDGTPLGLVFTSSAALELWDPAARPLPAEMARVAAAVLADGGRALLIDPGSEHSLRVEGVALTRLASREPWPQPWDDAAVRTAVVGELGPVLATGEIRVRLAGPVEAGCGAVDLLAAPVAPVPGLILQVRFQAGTAPGIVDERAKVLARRLSKSAALREVFDGVLAVQVVG